jgi:branched-chain amino acid transport system ATP-binding protein
MLSIGMALMAHPRILLLDEPSTGLSPGRAAEVMATVRRIRDTLGKAVLLIEQNVQQALACADHVVVLKTGTIVYDGEPGRLSRDPTELIALF